MKIKTKKFAVITAKILFVVAILYWLIMEGKLDLAATKIFIERPDALAFNLSLWVFGALLMGSFRWYLLLKGIGLQPTYWRTVQLHLTGLFFNTALPGAVGGDLVKAVYVLRDQNDHGRASALISIFLDRIVGLYGLFTIGLISICFNLQFFLSHVILAPLALTVFAIFLVTSLFFVAMFLPYTKDNDPIHKLLSAKIPLISIVRKVYTAFRSYKDAKKQVFIGYVLSIVYQCICLFFYLFLTRQLIETEISVTALFGILPIGMLTTAVPIAPGGLGIGHAVFDKLYNILGASGGANIFNIVCLGQMCLNLLGFFAFIALKSKKSTNK